MGKQESKLVINDDGSGQMESETAGTVPFEDPKLEGDSLTAGVKVKAMGRQFNATLTATADGDAISGQVKTMMGGASFEGKRA